MSASGMKRRVEKATRAVDEIFSDTSVDWTVTIEALEEVQEDIEGKLDTLREEHKADLE